MSKRLDSRWALSMATNAAQASGCQRSKRGAVLWVPSTGSHVIGYNHLPIGMCDGTNACKAVCGKRCIHAEQHALLAAANSTGICTWGAKMLHVKVVDSVAVPSGPPSCWQCSRLILGAGISTMWLLHEEGLRGYTAEEFHELTLENCGLTLLGEPLETNDHGTPP